jgi:hypothetical protein
MPTKSAIAFIIVLLTSSSVRAMTWAESRPIVPESIADVSDVLPPDLGQTCACSPPPIVVGLSPSFFGLTYLSTSHVPTVPFKILRIWNTSSPNAAGWVGLQPTSGAPSFTALNTWLAQANANGQDVMWTAGRNPPWTLTDGVGTIAVTNGGSGYTSPPTVTFTGGGGTGASATAVLGGTGGQQVVSVTVNISGTGYTSLPTIGFTSGSGVGAAGTATMTTCTGGLFGTGCPQPPSDIDLGDAKWKAFITALVTDSLAQTTHIKYYECVNEFDALSEWSGTIQQLVKFCGDMAAIVHSLDPAAQVWGPSSSTGNSFGVHGYGGFHGGTGYIAAGGDATYDVMNLHNYISGCNGAHPGNVWCDTPEGIGGASGGIVEYIAQAKILTNKPIGFSEGSWGCDAGNTITDALKVSFLLRDYLYMYNAGITNYVWYFWDTNGNPLSSSCGTLAPSDVAGPAAVAFTSLQAALVGSTHTVNSCVHPVLLQTWSCDLILTGPIPATIIWNPSTPTSFSLTGPYAAYTTQTNLKDGTTQAIVAHSVTADKNPIMVQ